MYNLYPIHIQYIIFLICNFLFSFPQSLALRFCNDSFSEQTVSTLQTDSLTKQITVDNRDITFEIFDTAGQERYRTITSSYYRNASAILLVYDMSDQASFESVADWMGECENYKEYFL